MLTYGISNNEIFKYSELLWGNYLNISKLWNYKLDGLIYTPLNQKYSNKIIEQKYKIYKWKPPELNSIDFYIEFKKDNNNKILNIFDNSDENNISNKGFRICYLYVGEMLNNIETPTLFKKSDNLHFCKLYLKNGIIKDIEDNIIHDKTVVEFIYNKNIENEDERWIPIRTRYDKTEFVLKNKQKYGNYINVATNIWKSMNENNDFKTISNLSNDISYENTNENIRKNINISQISKERITDETYFKKISNIGRSMRSYHNFIKSIILYEYCGKKVDINNNEKKLSILDIGIGRGADLMKFYHSKIDYLLGIDIDNFNLISSTDGTYSRYKTFKDKFPSFPKMDFCVCNAKEQFDFENQKNILNNINDRDKNIINKYFGSSQSKISNHKFNVFNCQFMVHFLFDNENTVNNFCENINNYLEKDGYLLLSTFNSEKILELFKNNNGLIDSYYTDNDGNKKLFFQLKSNFDTKNIKSKVGLSYEAYLSWINQENEYYTEYVVDKEYLINILKKKCNMSLVETCSFYEIYNNFKYFFDNGSNFESEPRTKKFFNQAKGFYSDKLLYEQVFSFLNCYYIFKKN